MADRPNKSHKARFYWNYRWLELFFKTRFGIYALNIMEIKTPSNHSYKKKINERMNQDFRCTFGNYHRSQKLGQNLVISGLIINNGLVVWEKLRIAHILGEQSSSSHFLGGAMAAWLKPCLVQGATLSCSCKVSKGPQKEQEWIVYICIQIIISFSVFYDHCLSSSFFYHYLCLCLLLCI